MSASDTIADNSLEVTEKSFNYSCGHPWGRLGYIKLEGRLPLSINLGIVP